MTADSTISTSSAAPGADYAATASEAYRAALEVIESVEPRIAAATRKELADQRDSLKLISSENYASPAVLLTMGTWFSDKYAEGTVGHRFYAACQNVDTVEALAAEHARELFGAPYAYAQPHSGIDANLVASGSGCAPGLAASACSACHWTPAGTSPTASGPTSPARCSTSAATAPTPKRG
jgi:glycine hydroxymethyltransferase